MCSCKNKIVVFFLLSGRFDFNDYFAVCNFCGHKINQWFLKNIIAAGYWPGSPKDLNYLFDQNLFRQWDFLQKRLPGTSEVSFLKALGDFSQAKGRVSSSTYKFHCLNTLLHVYTMDYTQLVNMSLSIKVILFLILFWTSVGFNNHCQHI